MIDDMNRPDFSNYLAHFTKDSELSANDENNPVWRYKDMSAQEKLISILESKIIKASSMPWTNARAVCFTECPWSSLMAHTKKYSAYGIGFSKKIVYAKNGGPVYYMRPDHYNEQMQDNAFVKHVLPFITPFAPVYRPRKMKETFSQTVDYSHEREWRVPHDFPFNYKDISFIILNDYDDMAKFPKQLKDAIGRDKFILIENYKQIETLWPVHKL